MARFGVIDLGSNSVRLVIYEVKRRGEGTKPFRALVDEKKMAGLAAYVSDGVFGDAGIRRATAVLEEHLKIARNLDCDRVDIFATAVLRNCTNTKEAVAAIEQAIHTPVRVLSAAEQSSFAQAGFDGAEGVEGALRSADGIARPAGPEHVRAVQGHDKARLTVHASACVAERAPSEERGIPEEVLGRIAVDHGLTVRETQILVYAFRGYSLQHIADLDVVSLNTVKSHWKNLYRKLDVHTRQELIDLVEARLIDGMPPSRP